MTERFGEESAHSRTAPPLVDVGGLKVAYAARDETALAGVDLRLDAGEDVLLLGPSGSGKSTLLHTLCGVVPGSYDADVEGRVRIGEHRDVPSTPVAELARTVGLLGQDPPSQVCLPHVEDELAFVLENRCVDPGLIGDRVQAMLQRFGLAHLAGRRTGQVSGGELQRIGLAATLLGEPELLLLDEPTAVLDPDAARDVAAAIAAVTDDGGPASIIVEHRLEELAHLPDRVVVLTADGRLAADGRAVEVFETHGTGLADAGVWLPLSVELSLVLELPLPELARAVSPVRRDRLLRLPAPEAVLRLPEVERGLRELAEAERPTHDDADGESVMEVRGASFAASGSVLVRDVDLTLRRGEITAVVGANGSGKTSLLMGMAGLLDRVEGQVEGASAGMVFQHPEDQFVGRGVADDIAHGLWAAGVDEAGVQARVAEALEVFALDDVARADPFRLSGGQKRRLSVAAISVLDHPVLLLDEPTFGQDRATAASIADTLVELASDGTAIAFATHDLRLVSRVAHRVVVVAGGRVVTIGSPGEVFSDRVMLDRARLGLPALLRWWASTSEEIDLYGLLDGLHVALPATRSESVA